MGGGAAVADGETVRAKLGKFASRFYPNLDEVIWNRERERVMQAELAGANYATMLADLPKLASDRPSHLVVVPQVGPEVDTWKAAGGNFFYEIAQAAREYAGADKVTIFAVAPGGRPG